MPKHNIFKRLFRSQQCISEMQDYEAYLLKELNRLTVENRILKGRINGQIDPLDFPNSRIEEENRNLF